MILLGGDFVNNINEAISRIKNLECPTGEVENRVADILEDYNVADRNELIINRDERYDSIEGEAYHARIPGSYQNSLIILAKSGLDDYVAKVVDVYLK